MTIYDYNRKLSDFGLARDCPKGETSYVITRVMGTFGYAAPQYVSTCTFYFFLIKTTCTFFFFF